MFCNKVNVTESFSQSLTTSILSRDLLFLTIYFIRSSKRLKVQMLGKRKTRSTVVSFACESNQGRDCCSSVCSN